MALESLLSTPEGALAVTQALHVVPRLAKVATGGTRGSVVAAKALAFLAAKFPDMVGAPQFVCPALCLELCAAGCLVLHCLASHSLAACALLPSPPVTFLVIRMYCSQRLQWREAIGDLDPARVATIQAAHAALA